MAIETLVEQRFNLFNVNEKKAPVNRSGFNLKSWETLSFDELCDEHNYNANRWGMRMGLQENGRRIMSLDFDCCGGKDKSGKRMGCPITKNKLDEYLHICETNDGMFLSSTEGNRNVLIDYTDCPELHQYSMTKFNYAGLEILLKGNQVIPPTATICKISLKLGKPREFMGEPFYIMTPNSPIYSYVCNLFEDVTDTESFSSTSSSSSSSSFSSSSSSSQTDKFVDLLMNVIKNEYVNGSKVISHSQWFQICGILKHNGYAKSIWIEYSGQISQTNTASKLWDSVKDAPMNIYGLQNIAKKVNPIGYKEWLLKWNIYYISIDDLNDTFKIAEIISKTLKQGLVLCGEVWYMLDKNNLWKQQNEPSYYIIEELRKYIDYSQLKTAYQITKTEGDEKEKFIKINKSYLSTYALVNASSKQSQIKAFLRTLLCDNKFCEKLDVTPDVIAFENGIMDIKTLIFRDGILPDDFITETIPYPYKKQCPIKRQYLDDVIKKILNNNPDHAEYYKRVLGHTMLGRPNLEKCMYFFVDKTTESKGDNGKSIMMELLTALMPNYVLKTSSKTLEEGNTKVHKQIAKMKGKRIVWMDELSPKKQDPEIMKVISDGTTINCEIMFGTSESVKVMFKMFALLNSIPAIDGKETACYNRYKQISFNSHFDKSGTRLEENPSNLEFIADPTLGDRLKAEYVNEMMNLLIEYGHKYYTDGLQNIPLQFKNDAKETQTSNDVLKSWINEHCQMTGKIALKQIVQDSKMTDKFVKDGMKRLGFKYDRDLSGLGKDSTGKAYKGGYEGCSITEVEEIFSEL
jgi:phage/plasmid-associated DNA primase